MSGHDEQLARMRAESDQAVEALGEAGRQLFAFYKGLLDAGFDEEQALALTVSMQAANLAREPRDE